jgi:hypothetical protein
LDLAQAARSPRAAATRANRTAHANRAARATAEPEATDRAAAAAATTAAAKPDAATTAATAPAATSAAATPAAVATTASSGFLHAAANVFLIEDIKRGETDVDHFLFAENEALIGRGIVGLRDTGSGHRGCGCTAHQRKTQSGGTQHFRGGGFSCAFLLRSLLEPWHGRFLRKFFCNHLAKCARQNRRARVTFALKRKTSRRVPFIFMNDIDT